MASVKIAIPPPITLQNMRFFDMMIIWQMVPLTTSRVFLASSCMERGVAIAVAFKKILDTYHRLGSKPCHGCHFIWI